MDNQSKSQEKIKKEVDVIHLEIQPALYEYNIESMDADKKAEADLNSKILEITMKIRNQTPELSKYLDEMTVTIPNEYNPKITLRNLKTYYDSLNAMLSKYILEHAGNEK